MQVLNFQSPYTTGERPYDIFKDRMSAIASIVSGVKQIILNKYEKKMLDAVIPQLGMTMTPEEADKTISLLGADPGDSINPPDLELKVGKAVDALFNQTSMGGNVLGAGTTPTIGGNVSGAGMTPTSDLQYKVPSELQYQPGGEVRLPAGSQQQALDYVNSLSDTKNIDFTEAFKVMKEKRPSFMGSLSPMEQWVMNQATAQKTSEKEELSKNLDLATKYVNYFKKEKIEETPAEKRAADWEQEQKEIQWKRSLEKMDIAEMSEKSAKAITDLGLTKVGATVDVTTGAATIQYTSKDQTLTKEELETRVKSITDQDSSLVVGQWTINAEGEMGVSLVQKEIPKLEKAEKVTPPEKPSWQTFQTMKEDLIESVENIQDFSEQMETMQGLGYDTTTINTSTYFCNIMKQKYDTIQEYAEYALAKISAGQGIEKVKNASGTLTGEIINHEELYAEYQKDMKNYDNQYFMVSGKHLFTSEEIAEQTQQETTDVTTTFVQEMIANKKNFNTLTPEQLKEAKRLGVDIEAGKKIFYKMMLDIYAKQ